MRLVAGRGAALRRALLARRVARELLWVQQHDVHLRHEEAAQRHRRAQDHAHAQARDLDLKRNRTNAMSSTDFIIRCDLSPSPQ